MSVKISKIVKTKALNCNIHPILYKFYLGLRNSLGAEIVHRRKRKSNTCIDVIFYENGVAIPTRRLNTRPEAEKWGYWVICRPQTQRNHMYYQEHRVYQLFLSPVHPKKRFYTQPVITPYLSTQENQAVYA